MRANYNMTGKERKALVDAIAAITGEAAEYQFVPTCAYKIGNITVDKKGTVICEDEEKLGRVMVRLGQMGYYPDAEQPADPEPGQETVQEAIELAQEPEGETTGLTISLPLSAANVGTLTNLISAKDSLIKKALGITDTRIRVTENKIEFPWFTRELTADEAKAYTLFISQLCKLSKELKHASSRPIETDNEKYTFRTWLLRMAFIGPQYKPARKILLQNLTGSSAFRNGSKPE
ncbi:MAG: virulence protein [Eubacterium sp.]|nr:virulence protein [Eubacterium sp.]